MSDHFCLLYILIGSPCVDFSSGAADTDSSASRCQGSGSFTDNNRGDVDRHKPWSTPAGH